MGMVHISSMKGFLGGLCAGAMLVAGIAPAAARDHGRHGGYYRGHPGGYGYGYPHRYRPYGRYRYRSGIGAGDVIGIAALVGAVAVIANSASRSRAESGYPDYRRDDPPGDGRGYQDRTYPDDRYDDQSDAEDDSQVSGEEDAAIDGCVNAVKAKVEDDHGGYAEILDVEEPRADGDGGWKIEGRLEQRSGYSDKKGFTLRFSCSVEDGHVTNVDIFDDRV